jgi:hypothetical protein
VTPEIYVRAVRDLYIQLPTTADRFTRSDRLLARSLFQRQISLQFVESALFLATARRLARNPDAPALPPVRSLHYHADSRIMPYGV